ncbi:PucR family transcriptional regulator [Streptomyces fuscigenes]|uniref:PucR family transcriptional regulator n=1 Tax=Streptomyces fuscigenes TaxID=1528880 RepID=UPI001F43B812|nr:helix-turn-helix domain-containing protein [Streptomyces fuscigenes]MCF3962651.1 helix-turn-helix domain-containing protein [Streptomyces fuscigenes]
MESTRSGDVSGAPAGALPRSAWLDLMVDAVATAAVEEACPESAGGAAFRNCLTALVRVHVQVMALTALSSGGRGAVVEEPARRLGRWLAEQRVPAPTVKDLYWTAMRRMLDLWSETQWRGLAAAGGGAAASGELVTRATRLVMDLTEEGKGLALAAHEAATADLLRGGNPRRRDLVLEILDGRHPKATFALEADLGHRLSGSHLCVLIRADDLAGAQKVFRAAQAATKIRDGLLVAIDGTTWAGWLSRPRPLDAGALGALREALAGTGARTAIGGPRTGLDGFRRAHQEARRAEDMRSVLALDGELCLNFNDFALETVLLSDVSAASAFAADELGELADRTPRAARIRGTLFAWLSSGSQTLTASRLGIHENTVRLRLATAADALGPDFTDRRIELLTALRLHRALGADRLLTAAGLATPDS